MSGGVLGQAGDAVAFQGSEETVPEVGVRFLVGKLDKALPELVEAADGIFGFRGGLDEALDEVVEAAAVDPFHTGGGAVEIGNEVLGLSLIHI